MPNVRCPGQTLLGAHCRNELVALVETSRRYKERAQWVRDAIREKLEREGIPVPEEYAYPPARAKKRTASPPKA